MSESYQIAIVGAGPAGLSAAARAAQVDLAENRATPSYILFEGFSAPAKTMQQYQKGKHVMAEPGFLDLRSDLPFAAGTREEILGAWGDGMKNLALEVEYNSEVQQINGQQGNFTLHLSDGRTVTAEHVVLAIGMAGNPRKLGTPGEDLPFVQYTLDDPSAFSDETIVVIGAGDAAIENALALAAQNQVIIVNRKDEFSRAKEGNLNAILTAINDPNVAFKCLYNSSPMQVENNSPEESPLRLTLNTPEGETVINCHRVIARLGGVPPRAFIESTGVTFPSTRPDAIPELSTHYESNIPGLYIIGSLGGFPLIKQAMNQGYDVIEYINGNDIKPADHPLLEYQFGILPYQLEVDRILQVFAQRIPLFGQLTSLQFRELIIESNVLVSYPDGPLFDEAKENLARLSARFNNLARKPRLPRLLKEGDLLYSEGEFGTSCFTMVDGEVNIVGHGITETLERGDFFGENSLISGRPRETSATAGSGCVVIQTPRRMLLKLMSSNDAIRAGIDALFIARELRRIFAPNTALRELLPIAERTEIHRYRAGDRIYEQDKSANSVFILRSGSALLSRLNSNGKLVTLGEIRAGQQIGQMAVMGDSIRRESAIASVASEAIELPQETFLTLLQDNELQIKALQAATSAALTNNSLMEARPESTVAMQFLMDQGLGEATDVLVINEHLCIGCDNCEIACAETHDGLSRLKRRAGKSFAHIHIPVSCRHCEQPHCMKDCPPNAINRASSGEVFIDNETCIGCGNCESNCPYDVIKMSAPATAKPSLMNWLLFGLGSGPGEAPQTNASESLAKKAVKCDACVGDAGGPACVRACPTGAAVRIGPEEYIRLMD